ncbi:Mitochondrial outer membrane protein porin 4 [Bienertia sinuspersici]
MGPAPFSDIGKKARDVLTKDYNFDHKITLSVPSATGMGLTATGIKMGQIFVGDISNQYRSGNTTVDVKVDTYSNVATKVTVDEALTGVKAALSFNIPDQKSGKLDLQYRNYHAAVNSSVGLNPTPTLDCNAAIGNEEISLGGEMAFNTASASFIKYNAGITFNKPDFSAALILMDKGQTLKASYFHIVDPSTAVAAEMTHRFSSYENGFTIGSSHVVDPITVVKTRFSDTGKVGMLWQREWRPKSLITFSGEYDTKAKNSASKFGIALALKP